MEAFSTRAVVGARPPIGTTVNPAEKFILLASPLLASGKPVLLEEQNQSQREMFSIEELAAYFAGSLACLSLAVGKDNPCGKRWSVWRLLPFRRLKAAPPA